MKSNKKSIYILILSYLTLIIGIFPIISNFDLISGEKPAIIFQNPKNAGYWTNFTYIHITGSNWSTAAGYDWCSGNGSWVNPYLIENIVMNSTTSPLANWASFLIEDSSNDYFIIRNCTIYSGGTKYGIVLDNVKNGTLDQNNCSNNDNGIRIVSNSDNNTVINSTTNFNSNNGIYIFTNSDDNIILNCTANNNSLGIGINGGYRNKIIDSNFTGNSVYAISIGSTFSDYSSIINNTMTDTGQGINIGQNADHNIISGNTIKDEVSSTGIYLNRNQNQTIINNHIEGMADGITLRGAHFNNISNNFIDNTVNYGINFFLDPSYNNTIAKNNITNSNFGVMIRINSKNNSIIENNIKSNQVGIRFATDDNDNNTVIGNNISGNSNTGIDVDANSDYNTFYSNYFTGVGTYAVDDGTGNSWNSATIGNYWADYPGNDLSGDGIGDTPYDISGSSNAQDLLPIWNVSLGYWVRGPINIDGDSGINDWNWAVSQAWCSGSGTWADPYIIENVSIDAQNGVYCILIQDSSVPFIIRNSTFYNVGTGSSARNIGLVNAHNGTIINNTCYDGRRGMYLESASSNNTIEDNIVHSHQISGISMYQSNNNRITNNTIYHLSPISLYRDIAILNCESTNLTKNTLYSRGIYFSGNLMVRATTHQIDTSNTISGKPIYYYANENYLNPSNFSNAGQIILANCDSAIIKNVNITHGRTGISLIFCDNVTITESNFSNTDGDGIYFDDSNNNRIVNNTFKDNTYSIYLYDSSDYNNITLNKINDTTIGIYTYLSNNFNRIENNTIGTSTSGIYIYNGNNNTISLNTIDASASQGIYIIAQSESNNVTKNTIRNCPLYGIHIENDAHWNKVWENIINNNDIGLYIDFSGPPSTLNLIYNNTFTGNNRHARDDCPNNYWNNSIIGNSWDNTTDADDDGIPDILIPYNIFGLGNARDYLPWRDDGDDNDPTINLISPQNNLETENAPLVNVSFYDYYGVNETWIQYIGYSGNISLAGSNSFQVDAAVWSQIQNGETLTIRIYANDTSGRTNYFDLSIKKPEAQGGTPPDNSIIIVIIGVVIGIGAVIGIAIVLKVKQKGRINQE
jgi:parallel beta-helix repeat protein